MWRHRSTVMGSLSKYLLREVEEMDVCNNMGEPPGQNMYVTFLLEADAEKTVMELITMGLIGP
ncbi:hypothetical protein A6R68_04935 [Neotoma lepida]|uniref:Uncharacterized protein n=1 Tax=Neotoma lepida TaxID=56216 RepID=A0A1A6GJY0_NEOLE|nr:hypothetical protein A6R68_04935 [Neotoma lepida]